MFAVSSAGSDFLDLRDDGPATLGGVLAHGANLQWQCLLVVSGNTGIKTNPKGVAKNLAGFRSGKSLFWGHFRRVAERGRNLMIMARLSSFEIVPRHPR